MLQWVLLSDLDNGDLEHWKDDSAPQYLAWPGNAATSNEWHHSPMDAKDEQWVEEELW